MAKHLRLGANFILPWILPKNNSLNDCYGIQCNMVKYLAKSLNFTFELIFESEGAGYQLENGTWTGMIARIVNQQVDMTASPIAIRFKPLNENIVDFSHLYSVENMVVLTAFDDSLELIQISVFDILDGMTQILFFTSFITITFAYLLFHKKLLVLKERFGQRVSSIMLSLFGVLFGKDIKIRKLVKTSSKNYFIICAWLFCAMLFYQIISSAILIIFSLKLPPRQIETIKDLVNSEKSLIVSPSFLAFNTIKDNLLKTIIDKFEKEKTKMNIKRMFSENKWIVDTSYGRNAIFLYELTVKMLTIFHSKSLKQNSKFRFIEEKYGDPVLLSVASSKRLPEEFRRQINLRVSQYYTTGIFSMEMRRVLSKSEPFFNFKYIDEKPFSPITIVNLTCLFKVVIIIWLLSVVIFVIELIYFILSIL